MLTIHYAAEGPKATLAFTGRIDGAAIPEISEKMANDPLLSESPEGLQVVFDLKDADYICSAFIRICLSTAKKTGPGNCSVVNSQPFVKKTFKIAGLDGILQID